MKNSVHFKYKQESIFLGELNDFKRKRKVHHFHNVQFEREFKKNK